ncbi:DUF1572 family protein [Cohnella candidum]|uniref:DUF1572 domain-containing protein n=1 Tax=Cohnella candidum TaxID=2674991 RepID=A0A3G3JU36_9BACL|nr:DUF1572 family protein [Cohnella candidum]AYQ71722.1 DUF1572 domain-containing protein [Cohnella candidum]
MEKQSDRDLASVVLETVLYDFRAMKKLGEGALAQLDDESVGWAPDGESNSAAVIVKHMAGNMISRWTDFLTSDGEKPSRKRDDEFIDDVSGLQEVMALWESGWGVLFEALEPLRPEDLLREVTIRGQPHTVLQAIHRQISHYAYHVGQLVYAAKARKSGEWKSLSIPRGQSAGFNDAMARKFGSR